MRKILLGNIILGLLFYKASEERNCFTKINKSLSYQIATEKGQICFGKSGFSQTYNLECLKSRNPKKNSKICGTPFLNDRKRQKDES